MEAFGSSHHCVRELSALGHTVRLIPPQYVKPFVNGAKNDRNEAEAICEAPGARGALRAVEVRGRHHCRYRSRSPFVWGRRPSPWPRLNRTSP
jgi:transposase